MKYRKKPLVIEAIQFMGTKDSKEEIYKKFPDLGVVNSPSPHSMFVQTLEGTMTAYRTDWIAKGIKGEFYPIRNDIFQETYEKVEESDASNT